MIVDVGSEVLVGTLDAPNEEDSRTEVYLYSDGNNDRTTVSAGPTLG